MGTGRNVGMAVCRCRGEASSVDVFQQACVETSANNAQTKTFFRHPVFVPSKTSMPYLTHSVSFMRLDSSRHEQYQPTGSQVEKPQVHAPNGLPENVVDSSRTRYEVPPVFVSARRRVLP